MAQHFEISKNSRSNTFFWSSALGLLSSCSSAQLFLFVNWIQSQLFIVFPCQQCELLVLCLKQNAHWKFQRNRMVPSPVNWEVNWITGSHEQWTMYTTKGLSIFKISLNLVIINLSIKCEKLLSGFHESLTKIVQFL